MTPTAGPVGHGAYTLRRSPEEATKIAWAYPIPSWGDETIPDRRERWAADPDWHEYDRLTTVALASLVGDIDVLILHVYGLSLKWPQTLPELCVIALYLFYLWSICRFRRHLPVMSATPPLTFPPPPSKEWQKLERSRGGTEVATCTF
jgi:hypothetical protein